MSISTTKWTTSTPTLMMTGITNIFTMQCLSEPTVIDIGTCRFGTRMRMCRTSTTLIAINRDIG